MDLKKLGIKIAQIRDEKKISAYELSLRLGKNKGYMHKVEHAKINMKMQSFLDICNELKVSPKEFFD